MIGDILRLAVAGTALQVRGWTTRLALLALTGLCFFVAAVFGLIAAFAALEPALGTIWTALLIGGVFLVFGLVVILANAVTRRRRIARQVAMAQTAALVAPALLRPELLLLAAAAGALFTLGGGRKK
ncbi:MAG: hypothetical protein K0S54_3306 [Alphaproteobacteria bacterium]|jgi:VIT1/CCC1 family predicted Fe2+/Mn2+ transporter|nr:hypothetical protein [Alphaproteobacteria bacterium]